MRFGVVLMPTDPWSQSVATAQRLDRLGYDHLWVYDHLSWRHYRDRAWHATVPWLTGIAAATTHIRVGTMVSSPNVRHPYALAKDAMTIDHVSGGRVTLGVGAGGEGYDADAFGDPSLTPRQRMDRFEEFTAVLDGLLRSEIEDHDGRWYTVNGARMLPGCVQEPRVPLAVAAGGPRGLALAARHADAWITYGDTSHRQTTADGCQAVVAEQVRRLEHSCDGIGRDPATVDRIFLVGHTDERPLSSLSNFEDFVGRYEAMGFTDVVFHHPRAEDPVWNDRPEMVSEIAAALIRPA
ncbi:MAG: LLM class flavin-dependent oxidoreductase [Acidimicrobiales bacterium]